MQNFTFDIPTVVHFGEGQIEKLGGEIAARAHRVLVLYGGGSVMLNGVYDAAIRQLKEHSIAWVDQPPDCHRPGGNPPLPGGKAGRCAGPGRRQRH